MKKLKDYLLRKEFVDILVEAVLVGILVLVISNYLEDKGSEKMYEYNAYFETLKIEYSDRKEIIEDFSKLLESRYFYSEYYLEGLVSGNTPPSVRENYRKSVDDWNIQKDYLKARLAIYFGYEYVEKNLITYEDDLNNEIPNTLHYKFTKLHNLINKVSSCGQVCYTDKVKAFQILDEIKKQKEDVVNYLTAEAGKDYTALKQETSYLRE